MDKFNINNLSSSSPLERTGTRPKSSSNPQILVSVLEPNSSPQKEKQNGPKTPQKPRSPIKPKPIQFGKPKTYGNTISQSKQHRFSQSDELSSYTAPQILPNVIEQFSQLRIKNSMYNEEDLDDSNRKQFRRRSNSLEIIKPSALALPTETQTPERLRTWKRRQMTLKTETPPLIKRTSSLLELSKIPMIDYSLSDNPTSRQRVIHEIIHTEYDYLRDIEILMSLYVKPLRGESKKGRCANLLTKKQNRIIFSNIELLFNLNCKFYESLQNEIRKTVETDQLIGNCFLQVGQFLKMYSEYCSNQKSALRFVSLARGVKRPNPQDQNFDMTKEQISAFSSFCDYTQTCPDSRKLDLPSFLIKPVQRVCKYPLLLRELIKSTDESHSDYLLLKQAFDMISATVQQIDESKVSFKISYKFSLC